MSGYTPLPDWLMATVPGPSVTAKERKDVAPPVATGWLCPRCGAAHSPYVGTCLSCRPPLRVASGANASDYGLFY